MSYMDESYYEAEKDIRVNRIEILEKEVKVLKLQLKREQQKVLNKMYELVGLKKEVTALSRALKSHGEIIEKYAALVLENQELKCKLELSQEL